MAPEPAGLGAVRCLVVADHLLRAGEQLVVGQHGIRAADDVFDVRLVQQPAVLAVERGGRHAAQRREQTVLRCQQISLRRDAALRRSAATVVAPDQLPVLCVDRVHVHAFGRKNARAEIGGAVVDQHSGAHRPQRDHLAAAQHLAFARRRAELPLLAAVVAAQAIDESVVRPDVHVVLPDRRSQPHWPAGQHVPSLPGPSGIQRYHATVGGRAEIDRAARCHHMECIVKVDSSPFGQSVPSAHGPRIRLAPSRFRLMTRMVRPALGQRQLQRFRSHPAARVVMPIRRPIARHRSGPERHQNQQRQCRAAKAARGSFLCSRSAAVRHPTDHDRVLLRNAIWGRS